MTNKKEDTLEKGIPVRLIWDLSENLETIYANHLLISHSGPEFYLIFGELATPVIQREEDVPSELKIIPKARIAVSPTQMREIAEAISSNVKTYLEKDKRHDDS